MGLYRLLQPVEIIVDKYIQISDISLRWPDIPVSVLDNDVIYINYFYTKPVFKNKYEYKIFYIPQSGIVKVFIVDPKIISNASLHVNSDDSLCLYHFRDYPPSKRFLLGTEIIAWTHEWISYYEGYLVNGNIWKGPEATHG